MRWVSRIFGESIRKAPILNNSRVEITKTGPTTHLTVNGLSIMGEIHQLIAFGKSRSMADRPRSCLIRLHGIQSFHLTESRSFVSCATRNLHGSWQFFQSQVVRL